MVCRGCVGECNPGGDVQLAAHSFANCSCTGPGSFSDIYARDESAFCRARGDCSRSLRVPSEA
jgi:hypothetical protein